MLEGPDLTGGRGPNGEPEPTRAASPQSGRTPRDRLIAIVVLSLLVFGVLVGIDIAQGDAPKLENVALGIAFMFAALGLGLLMGRFASDGFLRVFEVVLLLYCAGLVVTGVVQLIRGDDGWLLLGIGVVVGFGAALRLLPDKT